MLIGENNSGKTAFLDAVRICLDRLRRRGRGPFGDYDYRLPDAESAPMDSDPIEIELSFEETASEIWRDEIAQVLEGIVAFDDEDRRRVSLRVTSSFDRSTAEFNTDWDFLDADGQPLPGRAKTVAQLIEFQGEGTQSLAVLLLFRAFLRSQLSDLDPAASPITALEEPEAHLHPSAIRSLMGVVG